MCAKKNFGQHELIDHKYYSGSGTHVSALKYLCTLQLYVDHEEKRIDCLLPRYERMGDRYQVPTSRQIHRRVIELVWSTMGSDSVLYIAGCLQL